MKQRMVVKYFWLILVSLLIYCNSDTAPAKSPFVGDWYYLKTEALDYRIDSVIMECPRDPNRNLDMIITEDNIYHLNYKQGASSCTTDHYVTIGDHVIDYWKFTNLWTLEDTSTMKIVNNDTLIDTGIINYNCDYSNYRNVNYYVRSHFSYDISKLCKPALYNYQIPTCTNYSCDTTLPLTIAFFDYTPQDTTDDGCLVQYVDILINNKEVTPSSNGELRFKRAFVLDKDGIFLPRNIPLIRQQYGYQPIIVEFNLDRSFWMYSDSTINNGDIKTVSVKLQCSGNFRISFLTGQQKILKFYDEGTRFTHAFMESRVVFTHKVPEYPKQETPDTMIAKWF